MPKRLSPEDRARGKRLAEIREKLGKLTQYVMADRLNAAAEAMHLPQRYKHYAVSRMESGSIGFEDAAIWLSLDPQKRDWDWFVFGPPRPRAIDEDEGGEDENPPDVGRPRRVSGGPRRRK